MDRPYKYFILCNKTKNVIIETNQEPPPHQLQTWEEVPELGVGVKRLMQTKTAYIDTRYEAKLRLFNYINYTKKGLEIPRYKPFEGAEIGKSIPILNF